MPRMRPLVRVGIGGWCEECAGRGGDTHTKVKDVADIKDSIKDLEK